MKSSDPAKSVIPACWVILCLGATVHADNRFSLDYTVIADELSSGGAVAQSGSYSIGQSVGAMGGTAASADYQFRQGYTGQLLDPASLAISATPGSFSETATAQLSVSVVYDDGTGGTVFPHLVNWSVLNGPLAGISVNGVINPSPVLADSSAAVKGTWSGVEGTSSVTILETDPDNFGVYAADGIPDAWQTTHFGPDNPKGRADSDPDADGFTNLFEYLAGLDPTDPASTFSLWTYSPSPQRQNIEFGPLMPGRNYDLESSTDLTAWEPVLGAFVIRDNGRWRTVQDGQAGGPRKFYRIRISIP